MMKLTGERESGLTSLENSIQEWSQAELYIFYRLYNLLINQE